MDYVTPTRGTQKLFDSGFFPSITKTIELYSVIEELEKGIRTEHITGNGIYRKNREDELSLLKDECELDDNGAIAALFLIKKNIIKNIKESQSR